MRATSTSLTNSYIHPHPHTDTPTSFPFPRLSLCAKQAKEWLQLQAPAIILVGNGTAEQAADFAQQVAWPRDALFSDPAREVYNAMQFAKGMRSTFNLDALKVTVDSIRAGYPTVLSRTPTDPFQQGGAMVVDDALMVRYLHRDKFAGDHASIPDLQQAVDDAKTALVL